MKRRDHGSDSSQNNISALTPYTSPDMLPQCRTAGEVAQVGGSNLIMNEELTGRGDRVRVRNAVHNIGVDLMMLLSLVLHGFLHS